MVWCSPSESDHPDVGDERSAVLLAPASTNVLSAIANCVTALLHNSGTSIRRWEPGSRIFLAQFEMASKGAITVFLFEGHCIYGIGHVLVVIYSDGLHL